MGVEFPENSKHQLEVCRHGVILRPVSVVEGFPPGIVSRPGTVADLAESNQTWIFFQVNNKIKGERAKGVKGTCKGVIVSTMRSKWAKERCENTEGVRASEKSTD